MLLCGLAGTVCDACLCWCVRGGMGGLVGHALMCRRSVCACMSALLCLLMCGEGCLNWVGALV